MASLRDIRKRIRSVKNTQQITRAMKMVAAAKLRKAQDAIVAARPYAQALDQMIANLAARSEELAHPLLAARAARNVDLVVLTSDRGLAGGFNSNVIRRGNRFLLENARQYPRIRLITIGRKGNEFFRRRGVEILKDYPGLFAQVSFATASDVAEEATHRFLREENDAVFVVYNEFVSAISQRVVLTQVLPLQSIVPASSREGEGAAPRGIDFLYEPSREAVLDRLVPQAIAIK